MASEKTALVLGGGGILGAAEVGFIQRIEELGIAIDMVVGTSVGAINGAYLATHDAPASAGLRDVWSSLRGRTAFPRQPLHVALSLLRSRMSLYDDSFVRGLVEEHITARVFAAARTPLFITATDINSGRRHLFRDGSLLTAILASTAVPGVFPPVRIGNSLFVDGVVSADVDIAAAIELGATTVIAIELRSHLVPRRPRNIVELVSRCVQIMADGRVACSTEGAFHGANVIHVQLVVAPTDRGGFGEVDHLLEQSYAMACSVFDQCWDGTSLQGGDFHLAVPPAPVTAGVGTQVRRRAAEMRIPIRADLSRINRQASHSTTVFAVRSGARLFSERARLVVGSGSRARRATTGLGRRMAAQRLS